MDPTRPAARARLAGLAVDDLEAVLDPVGGRDAHARPRLVDDRERLLVADLAHRPPGVDIGREAALDLPQVPDPGDRALVQERVADRARGVVLAQTPQEPRLVELGREDVR